jgi:NADH/F420H2 dehydrogenase subunit C
MDVRTQVPTNGGWWQDKWGPAWKEQVDKFRARFGAVCTEVRMPGDYPTDVPILYVDKESIVEALSFLKSEPGFEYDFLADITATDEEIEPRFEIVYNLRSMAHHWRIRVKCRCPEDQDVPTVIGLWAGANWAEREVFDMFGVKFRGHPDLRRILMDERFQGHPLRKDYPLKGYQIFPTPMPVHPELLED